jgi:hypothetical protein
MGEDEEFRAVGFADRKPFLPINVFAVKAAKRRQ